MFSQKDQLVAVISAADLTEYNSLPLAATAEGAVSQNALTLEAVTKQNAVGTILAQFAQWFATQSGLLPSKEVVLEWVDEAVDALFAKMNRPALNLIKPFVKATVKQLISQLYDSTVGTGSTGPVTA